MVGALGDAGPAACGNYSRVHLQQEKKQIEQLGSDHQRA
jgi:hypothetical protein